MGVLIYDNGTTYEVDPKDIYDPFPEPEPQPEPQPEPTPDPVIEE